MTDLLSSTLWDDEISRDLLDSINETFFATLPDEDYPEYLSNTFIDKDKHNQAVSWAKSRFQVWPSAYASAAMTKHYKAIGGRFRASEQGAEGEEREVYLLHVGGLWDQHGKTSDTDQEAPKYKGPSANEGLTDACITNDPTPVTTGKEPHQTYKVGAELEPSDRFGGITAPTERPWQDGHNEIKDSTKLSTHEGGLKKWFEGETPPETVRKEVGGTTKSGDAKWAGGWVRVSPSTGEILGPCGRSSSDTKEGYPKCMSYQKWKSLSTEERKSAVERKRSADNPTQGKGNSPTHVSTEKHSASTSEKTNFPKHGDDTEVSLGASHWPKFPVEYAEELKKNYPQIWAKGGNIRGNSQYAKLVPIAKRGGKPVDETERSAIKLREAWVARHHNDHNINGVIAQIKWLAVGAQGVDGMKAVVEKAKAHHDKKQQLSSSVTLSDSVDMNSQDYWYDLRSALQDIGVKVLTEEDRAALLPTLRQMTGQEVEEGDIECVVELLHDYVDQTIEAKETEYSPGAEILEELEEIADYAYGDDKAELFSYSIDVLGTRLKKPKEEYSQLKAADRKALGDSDFGIPEARRFPMPDAEHVRKAAQMFSRAKGLSPDQKSKLKSRIKSKATKFGVSVPSLE
jgi:hypothetical protein